MYPEVETSWMHQMHDACRPPLTLVGPSIRFKAGGSEAQLTHYELRMIKHS